MPTNWTIAYREYGRFVYRMTNIFMAASPRSIFPLLTRLKNMLTSHLGTWVWPWDDGKGTCGPTLGEKWWTNFLVLTVYTFHFTIGVDAYWQLYLHLPNNCWHPYSNHEELVELHNFTSVRYSGSRGLVLCQDTTTVFQRRIQNIVDHVSPLLSPWRHNDFRFTLNISMTTHVLFENTKRFNQHTDVFNETPFYLILFYWKNKFKIKLKHRVFSYLCHT